MLPLTKNGNWKPAPIHSLGQTQLPRTTLDLGYQSRLEQGLLNTGLGLGVGAILGSVVNAFTARPSPLAAWGTAGLGVVLSLYSIVLTSDLDYARVVQFGSGAVAGFGGTQVLKARSKTA